MQLDQFKNYLVGYYYHSKGDFKMALKYYTKSLYSKDNKLVDYWRLLSLENIEKIVRYKRNESLFGKKIKAKASANN